MADPTAGAVQILRRTQPWVRLASLVAFLVASLMAGFSVNAILGGLSSQRFETAPFLFTYLLMTVVFFVPGVHLHQYANRIGVFVAQGHHVQLEAALDAQRKFWLFAGVLALAALLMLTIAAVLASV